MKGEFDGPNSTAAEATMVVSISPDSALNESSLNYADVVAVSPQTELSGLRSLAKGFSGRFMLEAESNTKLTTEVVAAFDEHVSFVHFDFATELHLARNIAPERRMFTHRVSDALQGEEVRRRIDAAPAFCHRVILPSGIKALEFLSANDFSNVVAYSEQDHEVWSRVLATVLGMRVVFCDRIHGSPASLRSLINQFQLPRIPAPIIYGIAGDPVTRSISPVVHNRRLRENSQEGVYLPFQVRNLAAFNDLSARLAHIGFDLRAFTITSPLKEEVAETFAAEREIVKTTRSANVLRLAGRNRADTTDDLGLIQVMEGSGMRVAGQRVAVLGCGGSGRVAARTLADMGADVSLFNRSAWRSEVARTLLQMPVLPLFELEPSQYDLLVNTVPFDVAEGLPFPVDGLPEELKLLDYTYGVETNPLACAFLAQGLTVIAGYQMLAYQLVLQLKALADLDVELLNENELRSLSETQSRENGIAGRGKAGQEHLTQRVKLNQWHQR